MPKELSPLQLARLEYQPKLPKALKLSPKKITAKAGKATTSVADQRAIKALFPGTYGQPEIHFEEGKKGGLNLDTLKVGVVLSGGQAPGGHNVISGLFDGLQALNKKNKLYGFLGGPSGISDNKFVELTEKIVDAYRNTGGFDIIGSGRTKLETAEQFQACAKNLKALGISALVVIGGDDSNTNAAVLAEYFAGNGMGIQVLGCPKTIDGDLKNKQVEISFGFDTATKVYSELIGNVARDCLSAKKYWHFIKLMGRSASHIGLECALKCQPNVTLISEEIAAKKQTLSQIAEEIAMTVVERAAEGKNYGVALVPEGLVEFVPEMKALIAELNDMLAHEEATFSGLTGDTAKIDFVASKLGALSKMAFNSLPLGIKAQLLADRDPHGNVQVSRIETEKLVMEMVAEKVDELKRQGKSKAKFSPIGHFFGYEGRCAFPSNFDTDYCYALGFNASFLVAAGLTGYISSVQHLTKPAKDWACGGVPLTMMMNVERRHGADKPVIRKALVELDAKPFKAFAKKRGEWAKADAYLFPGSIQYWGPSKVANMVTETLMLESK
jgi:pyrophosphate--fructose-6-phosphate 1-phosphotransferase